MLAVGFQIFNARRLSLSLSLYVRVQEKPSALLQLHGQQLASRASCEGQRGMKRVDAEEQRESERRPPVKTAVLTSPLFQTLFPTVPPHPANTNMGQNIAPLLLSHGPELLSSILWVAHCDAGVFGFTSFAGGRGPFYVSVG